MRVVVVVLACAACGGQISDDSSATDAAADATDVSVKDSSKVDVVVPPNDGGACNQVDVGLAPTITIQELAESAPPFAGQTTPLVGGVYILKSATVFTGPNGASGTVGSVQAALQLTKTSGGWDIEAAAITNPQTISRTSSIGTEPASGELDITGTCPSATPTQHARYAFVGSALEMQVDQSGTTIDEVYALITN